MENIYKAILFDLDGTLLDSFSLHYEAYDVMFAQFGISMSKELFLKSYSPNWHRTYEAFGLPNKHWNEANELWLKEAEKRRANLFDGVVEILDELSSVYSLGIVTSGSKSRVIRDLHRTGISAYFETVVTGDDIREPKPAPEGLEIALNALAIEPNHAIYVGDAHADFEMARAAGVRFFGVPSEFANLVSDHAEYEIQSITELPRSLGLNNKSNVG
jgi:HAD superfamily hydrolase (TIGR01549 family)